MVCDLLIVDHIPDIRGKCQLNRKRQYSRQCLNDIPGGTLHILGQILAVRPGVGDELCFVKLLGVIQRLLRRIPKIAVGFSLQRGQVIELWRIAALTHAVGFRDHRRLAITP